MNQAAIDQPRPADGYAGDISPQLAWQWASSGQAVLVDVRSDAERDWVGHVPGALAVVWKQWPGMRLNTDFDAQIRAAVPPATLVPLRPQCTTGSGRSRRAMLTDKPTSFDIAQRAGVSQPTVSRALRGDPTVSEATRKRIEAIAAQTSQSRRRRGTIPPRPHVPRENTSELSERRAWNVMRRASGLAWGGLAARRCLRRHSAAPYRPNACSRAPSARSQARCGRSSPTRALTWAQNFGPWFSSIRCAHSCAAT